jgi:hypothetical protein
VPVINIIIYVKLAGYLVIELIPPASNEPDERRIRGTHIKIIFFFVNFISAIILPRRKNAIHGKNGSSPEKIKPMKNPVRFQSPQ